MTAIAIKMKSYFLLIAVISSFFLFCSVFLGCIFTVDCSSRFPTLSYISKFRHHDRLFTFTMTFFSTAHSWLYISVYNHLQEIKNQFNCLVFWAFSYFGALNILFICLVPLIDQNISCFWHDLLSFCLLGSISVYTIAFTKYFGKKHPHFRKIQDSSRSLKIRCLQAAIVLCIITVIAEYHIANSSEYKDSFFHGTIQALVEYAISVCGFLCPWYMSNFLPDSQLIIRMVDKKVK